MWMPTCAFCATSSRSPRSCTSRPRPTGCPRTTRRVELTEAGRALLEPARIALRAAEDALPAGRAAGRGVAGELRFGRSHGARYGLEPLFATLAERHPALRLRFRQDSNAPLLADVRDGRLDLAVTFCARIPPDLE